MSFIERLKDDGVVCRLLRNKPTDIFAAIDSAMEEQQASHILRLNIDMMSLDVDEVNSRSKRLEISEEKFDVLTSSMLQIKELQKQQYAQNIRPYPGQGQINKEYSHGSWNQGSSCNPGNKAPYQYQQSKSDPGGEANMIGLLENMNTLAMGSPF